ncbi:MAG: hypothetical protein KDD11_19920 [Acidobacteria bacterium]|nr:hypothetical protein [Acidobacteriota bacterium]
MKQRLIPALCAGLLLLGVAAGIYKIHFPPGPVADEATYVMMAQSLWHDHDLRYEDRDLVRAYQLWDHGPHGLILFTTDGGATMFYGKPYVYSLAATPFYALFGVQGMVLFNMVLFLAMAACGWWMWRRQEGLVGLYVAGFFFASTSLIYVFWIQPEVFNMACVFFPVAIWLHLRRKAGWLRRDYLLLAVAGLLLAAVFVSKEPLVLFGLPIAVDLALQRRWRALPVLAAPALVGLVLLVGLQYHQSHRWSPYRDVQRRSFENSYPLEMPGDPWALYKGTNFGSWNKLPYETNPRVLARDVVYFFVGRHTGLLPYFPFALFALALFFVGPRDRSGWLLLAAVAGYCLLFFLVRSHNYHGGAGFIGNRYFASIYPVLFFLPGRLRVSKALIVPFLAAAVWVAPVLAVPVQQIAPEFGLQVHTRTPAFRALPLELTLLQGGTIPGYFIRYWNGATWIVPRENFFAQEENPDGVWVRGASRSEIFLVSPEPLETLSFSTQSVSAINVLTVRAGDRRVKVRYDTAEKRQGTPVSIPLGEPYARDLDGFVPGGSEYYYRIYLDSTDGMVPERRFPGTEDLRYLGTFLDFRPQ